MNIRAAIAATACAVLLAACGSSSTSGTSAGVPVAPTNGTATTTGTQTNATAPNTSPGAPPACVTADFALRFLGQAGATGHGEVGLALRNITPYQCRTYGYPGILFLDKAGNPLPTHPMHTTVDFFGNTTKTELVVLPGATVSFRLGVDHGAASPTGCTTAYGLQVIAPDDTHTTRTKFPRGVFECGGAVTVSPLQPAATAFAH